MYPEDHFSLAIRFEVKNKNKKIQTKKLSYVHMMYEN